MELTAWRRKIHVARAERMKNSIGKIASFWLVFLSLNSLLFAQTADGISATPQETYNEISSLLTGYACLNEERVEVGYRHPFLKLSYRSECDPKEPWVVDQINVTLIYDASVNCDKYCRIDFECADICDFLTYDDGSIAKQPQGVIEVTIPYLEASRVAKALKHFGQLYGAIAHKRDRFD
jgi:hypothetical protein